MYEKLVHVYEWMRVFIIPGIGIVSIFYYLDSKSKSRLIFCIGLVMLGLAAPYSFIIQETELKEFPQCVDIGEPETETEIWEVIIPVPASIHMLLYELGYIFTFLGLTSITLNSMKKNKLASSSDSDSI